MVTGRIEHRTAKISAVNGFATLLSLVFQLVSVPVCLHFWNQQSYGSWLALLSAFMLLRSLDGGFISYVGNELNVLYHRDEDALRLHLASAITGTVVIGSLQIAIVVAAVVFSPIAALLGMSSEQSGASATVGLLTLTCSWVLTGSYIGIIHRLQIPAGMMYQAAWWGMALQIGQFAAIIVAAFLRFTMLETSMAFAALQSVIYIASAFYLRRKLPDVYPWLRGATFSVGIGDLGRSLLLTGSNMIQQAGSNVVVLMIASFAGPVAVPIFTTVRTLSNLWTSVTTVLTAPLLPEVVRFHVKSEGLKLVSIHQVYWVVVGSAVNCGALLSYPLIPSLYARWTAHAVALDAPLLSLMLGSVIVANSGALVSMHLAGINSLGIGLRTAVARTVCSLGIGAIGFDHLGLASFGIGILLGECAAAGLNTRHLCRHEFASQGVRLLPDAYGSVLLSTGSCLVFFVGAGLGWWPSNGLLWAASLAAVVIAAVWGWRALDTQLQFRLARLTTSWLPLWQ